MDFEPEWSQSGAIVPVERVLARSTNVVILLSVIRAFSSGCMLNVEVVTRRGRLSADDWSGLQTGLRLAEEMSLNPAMQESGKSNALHMDQLAWFSVHYANGAVATTAASSQATEPSFSSSGPSTGPLLCWSPGGPSGGSREISFDQFGLWLHPLPPPEKFDLTVEWASGGIEVSTTELDGAAIVVAATRSVDHWPSD